jgi:hypothetical protein
MSTATIAGRPVTHARVYLPAWGVPWAEVSLADDAILAGRTTLNVADLVFSGTIMSGGIGPIGRAGYRLAAGAGTWGKKVGQKSYSNSAGVKASSVIDDAARECGESIEAATLPPATTRLGYAWTREAAPASRVLELVAPAGWYVNHSDGVTRIRTRTSLPLDVKATIQSVDRAREVVILSAPSIASIIPGVVVEGIVAADVLHEVTPTGGIRSTIWGNGQSSTNRALTALRRILEQLDPGRRFRGLYEYRIVSQENERLNLQPIRVSTGMPDLQRVPVRPGIPGAKATHLLGARVLVAFVDASPARPIVLGFEESDGAGFVPVDLSLEASGEIALADGVGRVIREGDSISITPGTATAGIAQGEILIIPAIPPATPVPPSRVKA